MYFNPITERYEKKMSDLKFYVSLGIISIFATVMTVFVFYGSKQSDEYDKYFSKIHIGTITDKLMIDDAKNEYQLEITYKFKFNGKTYKEVETINVKRDVYLSYDVGDTFDKHNPIVK